MQCGPAVSSEHRCFDRLLNPKVAPPAQTSQHKMATSSTPVPVQDLKEWHTPASRTEVIHELIHGVGQFAAS